MDIPSSVFFNDPSWLKKIHPPDHSIFSMPTERINYAICSFEIIMENTGSVVIEDWRTEIKVASEYKKLVDFLGTGPLGMVSLAAFDHRTFYIEENQITYIPKDNKPLIQKDNRYFEAHIIPECKEYMIPFEWQILARDFNASGTIYMKVEPEIEDKIIYEYVESEELLKKDEIISVVDKKNYTEKS